MYYEFPDVAEAYTFDHQVFIPTLLCNLTLLFN